MFFTSPKYNPADIDFTVLEKYSKATFAGGCFWCLEPAFAAEAGVQASIVGYIGGTKENPTYEEVCAGNTGHYEAIQVYFDPAVINYEKLLEIFWRQIDPTDSGGQFADRGDSYKTAIFYHDQTQKKLAEISRETLGNSHIYDKPIVTEIIEATVFYPAEEYHQAYYTKEPEHYAAYKYGSGRQSYIEKMWKK